MTISARNSHFFKYLFQKIQTRVVGETPTRGRQRIRWGGAGLPVTRILTQLYQFPVYFF
jgi:hypothetical protein